MMEKVLRCDGCDRVMWREGEVKRIGSGKRAKRTAVCLRCRNLKRHEARGLCKCCYNHVAEGRTAENLGSYPLRGRVMV